MPAQPPPEETKDIVYRSRGGAQPRGLDKQDALVNNFRAHQPNRRAKKLVRSPLPSSS